MVQFPTVHYALALRLLIKHDFCQLGFDSITLVQLGKEFPNNAIEFGGRIR